MALVVQKFGGTSVADADRIRVIADHAGRHMSFLIDPNTGEGHLVGGVFLIGAAV